jgi:hypothetical protein
MRQNIRRAILPLLVAALGFGATAAASAPVAAATSAPCRSVTGGPCGVLHGTVRITDQNGGETITVAKGTVIRLTLSGKTGVWTAPQTGDATVLHRVSAGTNHDGGASGSFRARTAGSADLTSTVHPHCSKVCTMMARLWTVHIVVSS